ncbi:MAG: NAD(P)/FAD-dependent oxidoreductase [Chloroflexota bacterium]
MKSEPVIVIGAGASGMMAAVRAAEMGAKVILLEKTDSPGKKLALSGKTRGNLTNARDLDEFIPMYGENGKFLYHAFYRFFRDELVQFLAGLGVPVKTERGGRVFPASDDAGDVVKAFERRLSETGVRLLTGARVIGIQVRGGKVIGVETDKEISPASAAILATGGGSYPQTGSSGDGYVLARELGHTIVKLRPALVPLVVEEIELAKSMQGVSLKNVRLTSYRLPAAKIDPHLAPDYDVGRGIVGKKAPSPVIESRLGEMMFTHFGIGGPITLLMSLAVVDALAEGVVSVAIDLKPALSEKELRLRLQRDFDALSKQHFRNILKGLLPQKLIDPFVKITGIAQEKPGSQLSAAERERLLSLLKCLRFNVKSPLSLASAMVTAGGVSLREIDPKTMASKLVRGLFFCGEVMDIDAATGGYNLQAAFSTGSLAGESAAEFVRDV